MPVLWREKSWGDAQVVAVRYHVRILDPAVFGVRGARNIFGGHCAVVEMARW